MCLLTHPSIWLSEIVPYVIIAMHECMRELENLCLLDKFKLWVSNPRPARLYYATRGHSCEVCVF